MFAIDQPPIHEHRCHKCWNGVENPQCRYLGRYRPREGDSVDLYHCAAWERYVVRSGANSFTGIGVDYLTKKTRGPYDMGPFFEAQRRLAALTGTSPSPTP